MAPEQFSFNFENKPQPPEASSESKEARTYEFAEKDECPECGNLYEGPGPGCKVCRNNPLKIAYLAKHPEQKDPRSN